MALVSGVRVPTRALLRPWALLWSTTLGRREPAAGGGWGGERRFGSQRVLVEPDAAAGVAVMKFRNPPVNCLSLELLTELVISLEKLENDKTFRGVILTSFLRIQSRGVSSGLEEDPPMLGNLWPRALLEMKSRVPEAFHQEDCPRVFSAGLDLTEICGRNPAHYAKYWKALQELWLRTYLSSLVLVAAINGACPAGGCVIALACDCRVLADNPKYHMGLNETLLGIVAPFWLKDMYVNTIGHRASEQALQLGLLFPPAEALQVGLVDQVVPEDQVLSAALSAMARWLAIPDHARQLTKNMMRKATADRLLRQRDTDIQNFVSFICRDSIQKSLQVYLEKLRQRKG